MPLLPTDATERKKLPIGTGVLDYFPLTMAEIAKASLAGNRQHMPGDVLHWDRSKSSDDFDAMIRHALQRNDPDAGEVSHVGAMAWRACAVAEKILESRNNPVKAKQAAKRETNILRDPTDQI